MGIGYEIRKETMKGEKRSPEERKGTIGRTRVT